MFDKMHIKVTSEIQEEPLLDMGYRSLPGDAQYRKRLVLDEGNGRLITVKLQPYYQSARLSIESNPSRYSCGEEFIEKVLKIAPVESMTIDRLDHAVDLSTPYLNIREIVRVKRKMNCDVYKEREAKRAKKLTGMTFGQRPEVISIYDKAYQLTSGLKLSKLPGESQGITTRVEVRQYNSKVPFKSIFELHAYLNYNPFENIESYTFKDESEPSDKLLRLRRDIQLVGFNDIYDELNASGNFNRTWGKYFIRGNIGNELHEIYRSNCRKFLVGTQAHTKVARNSMDSVKVTVN
jgi:hypothetical protein